METKLNRIKPSDAGIDPRALIRLFRDLDELGNISSCMVLRHGAVVAEGWWKPFAPEKKHMLFSLSKSFTSIASAFAAYEGKLDRDRPVLDYFPEYKERIPGIEENVAKLTTRHLLSMTTGHEPNADYIFGYDDCVGAFFSSHTGHERGVGFSYNTAATFMVAAVVRRAVGEDVADYLRPRLFEPLGITDYTWEKTADGTCCGGYGLSIKAEDLAKFGQFLLNRGEWNGVRLILGEYIDEATSKHINNWGGSKYQLLDSFEDEEMSEDAKASDWAQGYGQQFWRCIPKGVYRGDGAFGQICIVMPEYDIVVVSNAGGTDAQKQMYCIWNNITDDAVNYTANENTASDEAELVSLTSSLARPTLRGTIAAENFAAYNGKKFQLPSNLYGIRSFVLNVSEEGTEIRVQLKGSNDYDVLYAPCGAWNEGKISCAEQPSDGDMGNALSAVTNTGIYDEKRSYLALCSAMAEDGALLITVLPDRTPFRVNFTLRFKGGRAALHIDGMSAPACDLTAYCC